MKKKKQYIHTSAEIIVFVQNNNRLDKHVL